MPSTHRGHGVAHPPPLLLAELPDDPLAPAQVAPLQVWLVSVQSWHADPTFPQATSAEPDWQVPVESQHPLHDPPQLPPLLELVLPLLLPLPPLLLVAPDEVLLPLDPPLFP